MPESTKQTRIPPPSAPPIAHSRCARGQRESADATSCRDPGVVLRGDAQGFSSSYWTRVADRSVRPTVVVWADAKTGILTGAWPVALGSAG